MVSAPPASAGWSSVHPLTPFFSAGILLASLDGAARRGTQYPGKSISRTFTYFTNGTSEKCLYKCDFCKAILQKPLWGLRGRTQPKSGLAPSASSSWSSGIPCCTFSSRISASNSSTCGWGLGLSSGLGCGVWGFPHGARVVGFGLWGLRCGVWGVGCGV